jgi:hypothetical protein
MFESCAISFCFIKILGGYIMKEVQDILEEVLIKVRDLKYFRNVTLTKQDIEAVSIIREELTKFADSKDIDAVKLRFNNKESDKRKKDIETIKSMDINTMIEIRNVINKYLDDMILENDNK